MAFPFRAAHSSPETISRRKTSINLFVPKILSLTPVNSKICGEFLPNPMILKMGTPGGWGYQSVIVSIESSARHPPGRRRFKIILSRDQFAVTRSAILSYSAFDTIRRLTSSSVVLKGRASMM